MPTWVCRLYITHVTIVPGFNECRRSHLSCVDRVAWMVSMGNQQQCQIITATAALFLAVCGILLLVVPTEDIKQPPEFMVILFFSYMPHTGYKSKRGEGNISRWALNNIVRISSLSLWYRSVSGRADNNERLLCMFHLPCLAQCEVWFCTAQRGCLVWTTWETTAILSQIEKM